MRRFTEVINTVTGQECTRAVKGLVLVHLFNKVWRIGKKKLVDGKWHSIIYSPEDKEYHIWGKDVLNLYSELEDDDGNTYYRNNKPDPAKVKIYILTSILDQRENWSFNMNATPEVGSIVKVIFQNGTIKWTDPFTGDWKDHRMVIPSQIPTDINPEWEKSLGRFNPHEEQPSQFIWKPSTNYKNIVAWKKK